MAPRFVTQSERVVKRFGGAIRLAFLFSNLGYPITIPTIRKWTYPKARGGTGGYIPSEHWDLIFKAARLDGIVFSSMELDPRAQEEATDKQQYAYHEQAMPIHKYGIKLPDDEESYSRR